MTLLRPLVRVRRERLLAVLRHLPVQEIAVVLFLVTQACPTTGRVWTSASRIAEELRLSVGVVETFLDHLEALGHLRTSPARGAIRVIELGSLFVRDVEAPENLPIAPSDVCP